MDPHLQFSVLTFDQLSKTKSRKEKEAVLQVAVESYFGGCLAELLLFGTDVYSNFGVFCHGNPLRTSPRDPPSFEKALEILKGFRAHTFIGPSKVDNLHDLAYTSDPTWNLWASRIINKRLDLGVGPMTLNKVLGTTLREFPDTRYEKFDPQEEGADNTRSLFGDNFWIESLIRGVPVFILKGLGYVEIYGPYGKPLPNMHHIEHEVNSWDCGAMVFMGDLWCGNHETVQRVIGEQHNLASEGEIETLQFHIHDAMPCDYFLSQGSSIERPCPALALRKQMIPEGDTYTLKVHGEPFDSYSLVQHDVNLTSGYPGSLLKHVNESVPFGEHGGWYRILPKAKV